MLVRLILLYAGLALLGLAIGLMLIADAGVPPWDVFHLGVAERLDANLGTVIVVLSFVILLFWIPLRERPGLGTLSNASLLGVFVDVARHLLPDTRLTNWPARLGLVAVAIVIYGVGTGMYIGARLGPGSRDGLMTSLARRGWGSVRTVRTTIEVTVLVAGIVLGGKFGIATIAFAASIGPLAHHTIPFFSRLGAGERAPATGLFAQPVVE